MPVSETLVPRQAGISASSFVWGNAVFIATGNRTLLLSHRLGKEKDGNLIRQARRLNAPLPEYHPQFIMQLLLSNRASVVDEILLRLRDACRRSTDIDSPADFAYSALPLSKYTARSASSATVSAKLAEPSQRALEADVFGVGAHQANAGASDFFLSLASR